MDLTSLDLYFLLKELQAIKNAKIDKVFDDDSKILFQLHLPGKGKHYLKIILPSTIFLTKHKGSLKSGKFGINIRKHLKGTRIRAIEQVAFERIIKLTLDELILYIELFSPGNIVLCRDNKIVMAHTYKGFGSRVIRPNAEYEYPQRKFNFLNLKEKDLAELFQLSKKSSVVITLATELGLGGEYSEYLVEKAGIDKKKTNLNEKELRRLFDAVEKIKNLEPKAYISKNKIRPIRVVEPTDIKSSFNEALDEALTEKIQKENAQAVVSKHEKKKSKITSIIKSQKKRIKGLEISIEENQKKAEKIYENYAELDPLLKEFSAIAKKHPMKEIKAKLKKHKQIKKIDENNKKIVVEI